MSVPLQQIYKTRRNETDSNVFNGNAANLLLFGERGKGTNIQRYDSETLFYHRWRNKDGYDGQQLIDRGSGRSVTAGDITYEAHDYGNFEKVGPLGYTFPENNEQINTVPGDLILYQGSNLCIYYDTNSWNFTRIGKLDGMTQAEIKTWVNAGGDNVSVTLSVSELTGIRKVKADETKSQAYTLMGTLAQVGHKGIVIQNGKKIIR